MKTFKDLKPGDKIYYWDKGKLHEQTVHVANIEVQTSTYTGWNGKVIENKREILHLEAGKNSRTKKDLYFPNYSSTRFGYMNRFASLEAANNWIDSQKIRYNNKIEKLENKLNRYKKIVSKYDIATNKSSLFL